MYVNIKSPDHGLNNGANSIAVIAQCLTIDHLSSIVKETDYFSIRNGLLSAQLDLGITD